MIASHTDRLTSYWHLVVCHRMNASFSTSANVRRSKPDIFLTSVMFLDDGRHVVGGGFSAKIRRWQADVQKVGQPIGVDILSLAASRDGMWIVSDLC